MSAGSAFSGFSADNVKNDRPRKPWISTTQASETFTISLNASSGYPVQAMFLHGLLADSCTWALKNNAGSTVDSGTLDCSFPAESNLSGNPNNMHVSFVNQAHLLRSFFVVFDTTVTDNGSVVLTLTTSQNMGRQTLKGMPLHHGRGTDLQQDDCWIPVEQQSIFKTTAGSLWEAILLL